MKKTNKIILIGCGLAIVGVLGVSIKLDNELIRKLEAKHASEMSVCWQNAAELGGTCRLEVKKDRHNTIIGAEVIWEK